MFSCGETSVTVTFLTALHCSVTLPWRSGGTYLTANFGKATGHEQPHPSFPLLSLLETVCIGDSMYALGLIGYLVEQAPL